MKSSIFFPAALVWAIPSITLMSFTLGCYAPTQVYAQIISSSECTEPTKSTEPKSNSIVVPPSGTTVNLSDVRKLYDLKNYSEAEQLLRQHAQSLGSNADPLLALEIKNDLALVLLKQNKFAECEE